MGWLVPRLNLETCETVYSNANETWSTVGMRPSHLLVLLVRGRDDDVSLGHTVIVVLLVRYPWHVSKPWQFCRSQQNALQTHGNGFGSLSSLPKVH